MSKSFSKSAFKELQQVAKSQASEESDDEEISKITAGSQAREERDDEEISKITAGSQAREETTGSQAREERDDEEISAITEAFYSLATNGENTSRAGASTIPGGYILDEIKKKRKDFNYDLDPELATSSSSANKKKYALPETTTKTKRQVSQLQDTSEEPNNNKTYRSK